jgi:hypothetical protein
VKTILFLLFLFSQFSYAELSDGSPRYTIQVSSEKSYSGATKKISQYRKYGYAFIYEKNLQCLDAKIKNCKEQKTQSPSLFKGAIIQNLVE